MLHFSHIAKESNFQSSLLLHSTITSYFVPCFLYFVNYFTVIALFPLIFYLRIHYSTLTSQYNASAARFHPQKDWPYSYFPEIPLPFYKMLPYTTQLHCTPPSISHFPPSASRIMTLLSIIFHGHFDTACR